MHFARSSRTGLGLLLVLMALLSSGTATAQEGGRRKPDIKRGYLGPQLDRTAAGSVVMLWARPVGSGHDLLLARRTEQGGFEDARRVNAAEGDVRWLPIDEARPTLVTGDGDEVGVVWFDQAGHVWATLSADGGRSFAGPFQVDDGPGRPENAFAGADFASDGSLYVTWLDARGAPVDMEEPAQIFLARVGADGAGVERDLTSEHTASVCGCCRPTVQVGRGVIEVLFRNVTEDGFRDIHRLSGRIGGEFGAPERIGPPTWRIDACPMAGPIADGPQALWRDGSQQRARIVSGTTGTAALGVVMDPRDAKWASSSPRFVAGTDAGPDATSLLLVPGDPNGALLRRDGGRWTLVRDDLPAWCHSAIVIDRQLLLAGDEHGQLRLEAFDVTW